MKNLFALLMVTAVMLISLSVEAQTYKRIYQGVGADTLIESETLSKVINVNSSGVQTVSIQVFIEEVSGSTEGTATLLQSLDGLNYEATTSTTWSTGVDTIFSLTSTSFVGIYAKLEIVATGTTQKNNVTATLKSWNK